MYFLNKNNRYTVRYKPVHEIVSGGTSKLTGHDVVMGARPCVGAEKGFGPGVEHSESPDGRIDGQPTPLCGRPSGGAPDAGCRALDLPTAQRVSSERCVS